jgi:hypothetical protein
MTDAELQGIAAQALNMAKRDLERGDFNFLLAAYHAGDVPPLHRMDRIEALIIERLGEDWLNYGQTKDLGFSTLRYAIDLMPPDAVVIATGGNKFKETRKFRTLSVAQRQKLIAAGHARMHRAVAEGLMTICDAIWAIAQTPERVCQLVQEYDRRCGPIGQAEPLFFWQRELGGRIKMFGEEKNPKATAKAKNKTKRGRRQ